MSRGPGVITCPGCAEAFGPSTPLPTSFGPCGHTLCAACATMITDTPVCPVCAAPIADAAVNIALATFCSGDWANVRGPPPFTSC